MPKVEHLGSNIHYRVSGAGPLVILQHGFFGSHGEWKHFGYVDELKENFMVATVDSLAHGESDSPIEPSRYRCRERAGDIVAVIEHLGFRQAHVVGYSMGGWMASGVAQHFPERLASLAVGGWNCIDGMALGLLAGAGKPLLTWDEYMEKAQELSPAGSLDWVAGDTSIALSNCYEQLHDLDGGAEAVASLEAPVLLYNGVGDACHDPMQEFARKHRVEYLSLPGDHMSAMRNGAAALANLLLARLA